MRRTLNATSAIMALWGLSMLNPASVEAQTKAAQPGKLLFMRCAACHALSASASRKVGPHLQGVIGRKAGGLPDFAYSPGMRATNFTWNDATIDKWLTKPRAVVPNTTMAFAGIPDPAQRKALIAYLKNPTL